MRDCESGDVVWHGDHCRGAPGFGTARVARPSITWLQAGALVALLQVLFGGAHHWKRAHGFGIWRSGRWKHGDAWEEHFQGHARMHKDEWMAFRRQMREVGRKMHDHGRRWNGDRTAAGVGCGGRDHGRGW